jgi:holo-[acyl-carrier protein] synthase
LILGLGIDLVEIERVKTSHRRWGDRLLSRLMDDEEKDRLPADEDGRVRALALAIAGKEAASKALGTGWSHGVRWRDVVVGLEPARVELRGRAAFVARRLGSTGRTSTRLFVRGELAVGEVRLFA